MSKEKELKSLKSKLLELSNRKKRIIKRLITPIEEETSKVENKIKALENGAKR